MEGLNLLSCVIHRSRCWMHKSFLSQHLRHSSVSLYMVVLSFFFASFKLCLINNKLCFSQALWLGQKSRLAWADWSQPGKGPVTIGVKVWGRASGGSPTALLLAKGLDSPQPHPPFSHTWTNILPPLRVVMNTDEFHVKKMPFGKKVYLI